MAVVERLTAVEPDEAIGWSAQIAAFGQNLDQVSDDQSRDHRSGSAERQSVEREVHHPTIGERPGEVDRG